MRWIITLIIALGLLLLCVDWRGKKSTVDLLGSTSIQPFAEMLAQEFNRKDRGFAVEVQGGGSTMGIQAVANRVVEVGMCSRELKDAEKKDFKDIVIAYDGLAIVVHPSNPVQQLTRQQVRQMFAGEITNWTQVGGQDRPIRLITREEGSGTREAFTKLVMHHTDKPQAHGMPTRISRKALTQESNGSVRELVRHDPCAVGYMSLGLVGHDLKALAIDGAAPTPQEVTARRYKLIRPFLFVTRTDRPISDRATMFLDYALSATGQAMLVKEGLVSVR